MTLFRFGIHTDSLSVRENANVSAVTVPELLAIIIAVIDERPDIDDTYRLEAVRVKIDRPYVVGVVRTLAKL